MMFLIKTAFWLTILLLLIPDGQQNNQIYGTAEAAMKDLAAFCDRNPETCVNGKNVFAMLVQKAEFGARIVMDFVEGRTETADVMQSMPEASGTMPLQPAIWDLGESQDTLSTEDRETAWGG